MKKIVIHSAGSREKLQYIETEDLTPKNDEVLIEVRAIGINYADVCVRLGVYESAKEYVGWPITPGFEVSGTVKSVGPSVKKFKVGEKVVGFSFFNAYATEVCVSEKQVMPIPKGFSLEEAAGFSAVFFTAFHALHHNTVLRPGSTVLIHSAAGGVGTALVQLCKAHGLRVVGVIGSSHKRAYLEKFKPDVIIDKSKEDLWGVAKEAAPAGFQAIFDANGYTTFKDSYKHLAPMGKLLVYGAHGLLSKNTGRINYFKAIVGLLRTPRFWPLEMISSNKGVIGFNLSFLFQEEDLIRECVEGISELAASGDITPIPVTTFPFEKVREAHELIESGNSVGKIILVVSSAST
ncbi:hypothetical protein A9Q84_18145 [Halobacteriovorax marinus]|uniref:Enoyl reductase (ER) domain-containing protein n=1 Tax=Halobacteriovorax marinus TaxID=97084 RepID=A0A1Y5F3H3_9BACT|nr:hypothetical protein A9Q84_18145 [Halobacteriovorax marinus]